MKKIIKLGLFLVFGLSLAQVSSLDSLSARKNIIKTNVMAYAFKNINVSYERIITKRFSLGFGIGIMPSGKIPFLNSFLDEEDRQKIQGLEAGLTNFTIEPRFYMGKGYGKGFYIAPYYRYTNFSSNTFTFNYEYTDNSTSAKYNIPLQTSGKTNGKSFGLMVGSQFILNDSKSLVLDWYIAGAHYGSGKGDFDFVSNYALSADEQEMLKKDIEDLDIPYIEYKVETTQNGAKVKVDGPWLGFRTGLSLGYRF